MTELNAFWQTKEFLMPNPRNAKDAR